MRRWREEAVYNETVIRYVITAINHHGYRSIATPGRSRHFTHENREGAQKEIDNILSNPYNNRDTIRSCMGDPDTFEVRACKCWANGDIISLIEEPEKSEITKG